MEQPAAEARGLVAGGLGALDTIQSFPARGQIQHQLHLDAPRKKELMLLLVVKPPSAIPGIGRPWSSFGRYRAPALEMMLGHTSKISATAVCMMSPRLASRPKVAVLRNRNLFW